MSQPDFLPSTYVDLAQLEHAVRWLQQIQEFIDSHCLGAMPAITEALGSASNIDMDDQEYQLTRQATVFGGFYSAYGMQARNDGIYRSVQQSLRQFLTHLDSAETAMQTMIENYRVMEERNTAMAADIERALAGGNHPANPDPGSSVYPGTSGPYSY
jgi:hypothetical protein